MELRQMEYFVALADEQQFTRAASVCGVTQSGLSAAIRALEEEMGASLFVRSTRRVSPTDAGTALLPFAREMLAQSAKARDAVVRATHQLSGVLRIGAEQCLGVVDVPPLLERFHRRHPLIDIHFTQAGSHELAASVRSGDLDVAFVATTEHLGVLQRVELGRRGLVLLAPADDPLATGRRVTWDELNDREFIDFREAWGVRTLNDSLFDARGIRRRVRCTVDDLHTLLDLVDRGLGIAIVPQHVAGKREAARLATIALPADSTPDWTVSAVVAAAADPSSRHLLDLVDADLRVRQAAEEADTSAA
jgi:DNA-binding transcriptional LysR family regulator